MIKFDLNANDAESLLRHCLSVVPTGDDPRQVRRLQAALGRWPGTCALSASKITQSVSIE